MLWTMDRVALTVLIGAAFIRTGNLMNSEIIGLQSDLPWAFVFKQIDDVPRHPAQLYEALSYLIIFFLLYFLFTKRNWKKVEGSIFGLFMILMFIARFLLEFFKENQVGFEDSLSLNMGQILSIPFVIIGIVLLLKKKNKQKT
jgi:prolipoprotein diacylglyceryl transferase